MKKLIAAIVLLSMVTGCTSSTALGPCVGIGVRQDPSLIYQPSAWNLFLAIVFIETIIVPVIVLANETSCPVARVDLRP